MFINKSKDGKNNICGEQITKFRKNMKLSQKKFADLMQLHGLDIDKNAIQRIESGKRFVTDIELLTFSVVFNIDINELLIKNINH